ncbi:hypothetical protein K9M50_01515 [Patescibacteria group bacterium]|nr:hypothetical protein [Patescibacteria group bacterium]
MKAIKVFLVIIFAFVMQAEGQGQDLNLKQYGYIQKGKDTSNYVVYLQSKIANYKFINSKNNLVFRTDTVYDSVGYFKLKDEELYKLSKDDWLKAFANDGSVTRVAVDHRHDKYKSKNNVTIADLLIRYSSNNDELCIVNKENSKAKEVKIAYLFLLILSLFLALFFSVYRNMFLSALILLSIAILMSLGDANSELIKLLYSAYAFLVLVIGFAFIYIPKNRKFILVSSLFFHILVIAILAIKILPFLSLLRTLIFIFWFILTTALRHKLLLYYLKKYKEVN